MVATYEVHRGDDMPTASEFWSAAAQVVSERGYMVIGFSEGSEQPKLGSELDNVLGFKPEQPVRIVGFLGLAGLERTS